MGAGRRVTPGGLWRSLYPILVYMSMQVAACAFYVIGLAVFMAASGNMPRDVSGYIMERYAAATITILLLASLFTIPLFAWLYYRDVQKKKRAGWNEEWFPLTEWKLLWAAVGSAALALFGNGLISLMPLGQWADSFEEVNETLYTGSIWLRMAAVGFSGPIVEELTMRGLMYQRFRTMMRPAAAMIWSAAVFGVFHGNVIQGVYAFLVGLFFAWLMERTQRILVPMIGHMSANLFVVLLEDTGALERLYGSVTGYVGMMVLSGIVFVWSAAMLKDS